MPAVVRLGDYGSGHGCWPPRPNDQGSPNVVCNGKPVHRLGDHWEVHCCDGNCHDGYAAGGSPNVFCNGKPVCRIGDPISCGSYMAEGSPNVFCNGGG